MDKTKKIAELAAEIVRLKHDRDKYIKWVSDLRGSLNRITDVANEPKNWI